MARIIELAGSPGVGKTTIYKEIEKQYNKKSKWVPAHLLYPSARLDYQSFIKFFKNLSNIIEGTHGKVGTVGFIGARKRFVSQYKEYIDLCWNSLMIKQRKSLNGYDLRIEKAQQFSNTIENVRYIQESNSDKAAILEEGLIHLIDTICFCSEPEEISKFLDVMPLPDVVINIQTEVSENVRRIMQRGSTLTMHESLTFQQLEYYTRQSQDRRNIINRLLQEKGIPILHIDSKEEVKINANKIIAFVESQEITKPDSIMELN